MAAVAHVVRSEDQIVDRWDGSLTLREARAQYFAFNDFGDDGGYSAKWVDFKLGPIPFPFPNTKQRVDAVRYHDLHHVMTGYRTNFIGELEISAWELGSGCADKYAAWVLNLGGYAMGMLLSPRRVFRALVRGRRSKNLYRYQLDAVLDRTVSDVQRELGLNDAASRPRAGDLAVAIALWLVGWTVGMITFCTFLPLAPIGFVAGHVFKK